MMTPPTCTKNLPFDGMQFDRFDFERYPDGHYRIIDSQTGEIIYEDNPCRGCPNSKRRE